MSGATAIFVALQPARDHTHDQARAAKRLGDQPMIAHMKLDGRLARNHLKGAAGDAIHALLCRAGHDLRLILRHLAKLLRALLQLLAALDHERDAGLKPA